MIKATLISDSDGNEYKLPKDVYIWIGVQHGDMSTIQIGCTFHKSIEDAEKGQMVNTNKQLQMQCLLSGQYAVDMKENDNKYTLSELKDFLQEETIKQMKAEHLQAKLKHITKFEIV
jgi:high-affinity Fe2+/Pb2+ permease